MKHVSIGVAQELRHIPISDLHLHTLCGELAPIWEVMTRGDYLEYGVDPLFAPTCTKCAVLLDELMEKAV